MAQCNLKQPVSQNFNVGVSHSRSLSQPTTFFANNCLPPLSPIPPSESSLASSNSNMKELSLEEMDVSSRDPQPMGPSFPRENAFRGNDSLPPRRGHRRSNSAVPLGFSDMIQSSPQLVPISRQGNDKPVGLKMRDMDMVGYGKSGVEGIGDGKSEGQVVDDFFHSLMNLENKDKESVISGNKMSGCESSKIESESVSRNGTGSREGVKRSAVGDIAPPARHYRSLSMDSAIGKFHLSNESPISLTRVDQLPPSNSGTENLAKLNFDFGHGEFTEAELKKIMADERLADIAVSEPKRAKRILANRQSAARSKERKFRYISELEHKVQTLQTEATTLSSQVTLLQKDYAELVNQNNELKFRVQAMEQQAQLRDALHEALTAEVQRLKFANMEVREEGRTSNGIAQQAPVKHHMFQMQQLQQHQQQQSNQMQRLTAAPTSTTSSTTPSAAPASA